MRPFNILKDYSPYLRDCRYSHIPTPNSPDMMPPPPFPSYLDLAKHYLDYSLNLILMMHSIGIPINAHYYVQIRIKV